MVKLCRELNAHGVLYLVVGGFAIIQQGLPRMTEDVDLLLDPSRENQARLRQALLYLPDQAVRELGDEDLSKFVVVRVADDILVDLMFSACGIRYSEAVNDIEVRELQGVFIPFASAALLWRTKQTVRAKDEGDRLFLREKLRLPPPSAPQDKPRLPTRFWKTVSAVSLLAVVLLLVLLFRRG